MRTPLATVAATIVALAVVSLPVPAAAEECRWVEVGTDAAGNPIYERECIDGDEDDESGGDDGGSGPSEPTCEFNPPLYDEFCRGEDRCFLNDPAAIEDPDELADRPKPSPDSYAVHYECERPDGSTYEQYSWNDEFDEGPTPVDRARSAVGALVLPEFEIRFNPPGRSIVNLPTWWWAEGAPTGRVVGSEALGFRAIAQPRSMTVNPGDGAPAFSCPLTTSRSDVCTHTYRRASVAGDARTEDGRPAHAARVSVTWEISFEEDGAPVEVPDLPADLRTISRSADVAVPVREVQSVVTDIG